jgi:hypothetical protein
MSVEDLILIINFISLNIFYILSVHKIHKIVSSLFLWYNKLNSYNRNK